MRRPASPDGPRTERVYLGATPAEVARWTAAAEADGLRIRDWVRYLCDLRARRQDAGLPPSGEIAPRPDALAARVLELARQEPRPTDAQIAASVGASLDTVRRIRERAGIRTAPEIPLPAGARRWREVVGPLLAEGLDASAIAERTGYPRRTVQTYLSALRREAKEK